MAIGGGWGGCYRMSKGGYMMSIRRLYDEHKEFIWGRAGGYDRVP